MKKILAVCACCMVTLAAYSQKINVTNGSLDCLGGESVIDFRFTYDDMRVGKMSEQDYVEKKTREHNAKESGRGDR
ncbi:MAG: hypothetical protein LUE10_02580 [Alistipes sp.]|nr:hypothetical protein [Alistipes sp.]